MLHSLAQIVAPDLPEPVEGLLCSRQLLLLPQQHPPR